MKVKTLPHKYMVAAQRYFRGDKLKDIAKAIGVSKVHMSRVRNSEPFKEYLEALAKRADMQFYSVEEWTALNAKRTCETLDEIMSNPSTPVSLRAKALFKALKIAGYG